MLLYLKKELLKVKEILILMWPSITFLKAVEKYKKWKADTYTEKS